MSTTPLSEDLKLLVEAAQTDLPDAFFPARVEHAVLSAAGAPMARRGRWFSRPVLLVAAAAILFSAIGLAAAVAWRSGRAESVPRTAPGVVLRAEPIAAPAQGVVEDTVPAARAVEPSPVAPARHRAAPSLERPIAATEAEAVPPEPEATGPSELDLMKRAQAATAANPALALALCGEHQQRFARGVLAEEREAIAVEALGRLGRTAEARARAARFLRDHPGSAYRARMQAAIDTGVR